MILNSENRNRPLILNQAFNIWCIQMQNIVLLKIYTITYQKIKVVKVIKTTLKQMQATIIIIESIY